jgi:hypothetical protein
MKKKLSFGMAILFCMAVLSCGSKKESAAVIAQKWCALNAKVHNATDDAAKDAAKMLRQKFEKEMENKYKSNEAFMKEIGKEVEKCEGASEGR